MRPAARPACAAGMGFTGLSDTCAQVISELVTNSGAPRGALSYPRCSREKLKGGSWA